MFGNLINTSPNPSQTITYKNNVYSRGKSRIVQCKGSGYLVVRKLFQLQKHKIQVTEKQ